MSKRIQEDEGHRHLPLISNISKRPKVQRDGEREDEDGQGAIPVACTRMFSHDDYTVGWICALPLEMAAAKAMLDEIHGDLKRQPNDNNAYILGRIGGHNIVIACLPLGVYGTISATTVASQMLSSFRSICFWLVVGIGGGAPSEKADIRLGDVVVSIPTRFGAVVQYDYGKTGRDGLFERTGTLNKPHPLLLTAVAKLKANHESMSSRREHPHMTASYPYPSHKQDLLFEAEYDHIGSEDTCESCDKGKLVPRVPRVDNNPEVHYGLIASGNQVMKHGATRDRLARELGILCFEMEAAGLMDNFPCLVIRGICDYADSHKNKGWQEYAATTAAGYTKELLSVVPTSQVVKTPVVTAVMSDSNMKQRQFFMDALGFDQIDARHKTIKNAHVKTCKWLLDKPEYRNWLDIDKLKEHHGFLWMKGKPGAGKSTIMKYVLAHAKRTMKDRIIIWFFFNARGEDLEKSTIGMYRSLLLQLLEAVPELQCVIDSLGSTMRNSSGQYQWSVEILKELFENAIKILGQHQITCFIDALDECDEKEIRDMVAYFEHVGEQAILHRVHLNVCFSSRHYPFITIKKGISLTLEGQEGHNQDIANYLYSELKIGHTKLAEQIRRELLDKALGVFMWVVLVVEILNAEYDRGRMHALQQKVRDIPADLHELFRDILTRGHNNRDELLLCIQWVLFSKRPLRPEELYFAILSGIEPEAARQWCPEEITTEIMRRFILNSSKGLVEATKSRNPKIQFIHESVRDFLLKENGLRDLWSDHGSNFQRLSHDQLKQCCLTYMTTDIASHVPFNNSLPKPSPKDAASLRQSVNDKFPFLEYAIRNVLYHADVAESSGMPQDDFIQGFPLLHWINVHNLIERHEVRRYSQNASLLYILAEGNMANLIKTLIRLCPSRDPILDVGEERYGIPILAALATGSEDAVYTILKLEVDQHATDSALHDSYIQYCQDPNKRAQYGRDLKYRKDKTILSYAIEYGDITFVRFLLDMGKFNLDSSSNDGGTMLSLAAEQGHDAITRMLLEKGLHPDSSDKYGRTPLHHAARNGHEAIVKLLLSCEKVDPDARDTMHRTPLHHAAENGHEAIVKLLLSSEKVDPYARDTIHWTPLFHAALRGHKAIVKLLFSSEKIDPDARDINGWSPLHHAAENGHEAIVKLLLFYLRE